MPLTAMETNLEIEKVSKKGADIQDMVKSPKTILDFFKTPEKPVPSKQKSLLQFFTKPGENEDSNFDRTNEKENAGTLVGKASLTVRDCPLKGNFAAEKTTTKDNKSTPNTVKTNQKVKKKQKNDETVKENKTNTISNSVCIADEDTVLDDSEHVVVLVSDSSTLDETLTEHSNEKENENNHLHEKQTSENNTGTNSENETGNSEVDSHQKLSNKEYISEEHIIEVNEHEKPIKCEEAGNTDREENDHEVSDQSNKVQGTQEEAVFLKPSNSKLISKKTSLKCKEMMNLLKETIGTDMGKKSKRHKNKHKHKTKAENEVESKVNSLKEIINEKRKGRKKVKFSESIREVKTEEKILETDSDVMSKTSSIEEKNDEVIDTSVDKTLECKDEEKGSEMNPGTQSDTNTTTLDDKGGDQQNDENKKQNQQGQKTKQSKSGSKKSKKSTSNKTNKSANLKDIKEDCDTKTEDQTSETKSISYEDFLKNLEKEPSVDTDEPTVLEAERETDTEKVKPELIEDCEDMDLSIENVGDKQENVLEDNSENLEVAGENETSGTNENDEKHCNTPKAKKKPSKSEPKSASLTETKSAGIARFFTVFTSTPGKPKPETESESIQKQTASPSNKKTKKSKNIRKLDKICSSNGVNTEKNSEEISVLKVQEDSNISQSDSIEIVEDTIGDGIKIEKDAEVEQRKLDFLNSKSSLKSGKTTQAVLSFGSTGLTMAKCEKVEVNAGDEVNTDDINTNVKSLKTKGKKGSKPTGKSKQNQNLSDDSNVFETPKAKKRGRKSKPKENVDKQPSESEESCDHSQSQTDDSEDSTRRRSLRSRYKVAKFEMDEEKRTPIKLKLKRDKNSSSCDDIDSSATMTKKSKLTSKQSKAKALIDKAKKRKKKTKLKPDITDEEAERKAKKKLKKKKKHKSGNDSHDEVVEHRRSSRLVGRTMASMEDVSIENIVILSDEDEDNPKVRKRRTKKAEKTEKLEKKKDKEQEIPAAKDSPKTKKVRSPQKKTATPKKQGKLAPIFIGKAKPVEEKPPLDPEVAKQRNLFLMSGVPEELKKQSAKTQAAAVATDYPPLPTVSHVLQIPKLEEDSAEEQRGALDVWQLKTAGLKLRRPGEAFCCLPMSKFTGDLINRQMNNVDLSLIKNFTCYPPLDSQIEEACVGEVSCYNPGFPVNKLFTALKKLKEAAEQAQLETDLDKTDVQPAEPEVITVIDAESDKKKKKGRKSKLKLQKEDKAEEKLPKLSEATEKKKYVKNLLWTDKYQPSSSTEVIGNSSSMKKLKSWLSEWKHILDREAKKARKLLMKKNKGKLQKTQAADDGWDEDSDFDMDSDDSDIEDTLCNTTLITGPHGSGKTAAVYALAQELGFKVHEVNASSSRNGKKILSQLQEATQSHQVSHQGCGTPIKNPAAAQGSLTPKPAKMPTAFTNLFNKKKETSTVIDVDQKKSKKRKREPADIEESPKKKRSKKTDSKEKTKTLKPTFLDIDESSNGLVQGLNLSSTTMILFDEVDLVFDDDKGFLLAVQTFMATTKVPIVLTTTRPSFAAQFDGRYETLTFKYPSVASLCSYLQLICLLEGLRVGPTILSELLQLLNCDVRKSLVSLQFMTESGGSLVQTVCSVAKPGTVLANQAVPAVEETIESSQDSQDSSKTGFNPTFGDNDDDDFVMLKPRTNRQRLLLEDDNSNSVDAFAHMFQQRQPEVALNGKEDEDAKLYPCVHGLGVSPLLGLSLGQGENLQDLLVKNMKMSTLSNLLESCNACETYRAFCQNLLSNNLPLLLPLVTRVTDHVISSGKDNSAERKGKKRKRIQTDLNDSEASNDASDSNIDSVITEENTAEVETKTEKTASDRAENMCSIKALSAFSRFYDTVGMLDMVQSQENLKGVNCVRTTCGRRTYGSIQPGLDDSLPKFDTRSDIDCEVSRCYSSEVEVRSMCRLYEEIDRVQGEVEQLCSNNPAYSEEYILSVLRGNEKFSLLDRSHPCQASGERRAEDNVVQNLPLLMYKHHRSLQLDYLPTLREISRTEQNRQIANTKRRFHHYFDSITLPLKDTTLNILSSTFT